MAKVPRVTKENVVIYTNPSFGIFTLKNANQYNVSVFDVLGEKLAVSPDVKGAVYLSTSGVYFIRLEHKTTHFVLTEKVVVE